ncbi:MAG: hypothetical protein O3A51_03655, partial [Verrucomicrobia bacterium]|nr:hypothetical protein [Verrucomicrobiota bacterium]
TMRLKLAGRGEARFAVVGDAQPVVERPCVLSTEVAPQRTFYTVLLTGPTEIVLVFAEQA